MQVRKQTGATIIALMSADHSKKINPGADQVFQAGMTVIIAGERQQIQAFKRLLVKGGS
jgi:TrkA domain protein